MGRGTAQAAKHSGQYEARCCWGLWGLAWAGNGGTCMHSLVAAPADAALVSRGGEVAGVRLGGAGRGTENGGSGSIPAA